MRAISVCAFFMVSVVVGDVGQPQNDCSEDGERVKMPCMVKY